VSAAIRRFAVAVAVLFVGAACPSSGHRVSVCDLVRDPAKYNQKEIEISGFVSHDFEDFRLFDPTCPSREVSIWIEYGGKYGSGTVYCCNDSSQARDQPLVVDGIPTTLIQDGPFQRFDDFVQKEQNTIVYATLRGRFFSGRKVTLPGGTAWTGYGHFGLSSLFVIEQVVKVAPHDLPDADYRASYDYPHTEGEGCYSSQFELPSFQEVIAQQQQAEGAGVQWRFDDPNRVATAALQPQLGGTQLVLTQRKRSPGSIVFEGSAPGGTKRYMAVVSHPYWLTRYAGDRRHVIWVLTAAYEFGCPN
jgi:hypothetical protein